LLVLPRSIHFDAARDAPKRSTIEAQANKSFPVRLKQAGRGFFGSCEFTDRVLTFNQQPPESRRRPGSLILENEGHTARTLIGETDVRLQSSIQDRKQVVSKRARVFLNGALPAR
jgi:hypothetical protein